VTRKLVTKTVATNIVILQKRDYSIILDFTGNYTELKHSSE